MKNNLTPYSGPERRRYKRISYWTYARYKETDTAAEFKHAQVRDISEGGLLLETKEKLKLNKLLEIRLYIPHSHGYHLLKPKVKTIWQRPADLKDYWYTGVEFQPLDAQSKDILTRFIASCENQFTKLHKDILKDNYLHIPYWCILKQTEISAKLSSKVEQVKNSYNIIFESEKEYPFQSQLELELKIPTLTMPFKAKGIVLESKEFPKGSTYSVLLQLINLTEEQLEAIKEFAQA